MSDLDNLLEFWLGSSDPEKMATHREEWWVKDDAFDHRIRNEFGDLHDQAIEGALDSWKETALGCVGLAILLDQFPRNMYRNSALAFEYDDKARELTKHALDKGFDQDVPMGARLFLYLPLEHSENIDHQNACVALMQAMGDEGYVDFALKHQVIIERFGRFPHRNDALGRISTEEEIEFLKGPDSGF